MPLYEGKTVCCTVDCCMLAAITVELSDCGGKAVLLYEGNTVCCIVGRCMFSGITVAVPNCRINAKLLYVGNTVCYVEGCWVPAEVIIAVSCKVLARSFATGTCIFTGCAVRCLS